MTKPRDPEALLTAYLASGMEVLPDRVVDAVLDEIHRTRQRVVLGPRMSRSAFRARFAAAAVVAMLALGAAFLFQRGKVDVAAPSPSAEASHSPSQPAVVNATPTPTAEVLSLDLTWTQVDLDAGQGQVAWLGDRFVVIDSSGAVRTSTDGRSWDVLQPGDPDPGYAELLKERASLVTWEDQIVGWSNPEDGPDIAGKPPITARDVLRIVQPPAEPTETTPFEGRIESIAIGPAGIVAQVHSDLDWDAWVTKKLGLRTNNDWTCCVRDVTFQNGVLEIKLSNRPSLKVVWADEGFELGDFQDAGFGWYSPDGREWTLMPRFVTPEEFPGRGIPTGFGEVVGVTDGFIARGGTPDETCLLPDGCSSMWHSTDGLTWRNLGQPEADPQQADSARLVPWRGGALVTDGVARFDVWTSQGYSELPMGADFPTQAEFRDPTYTPLATGPLGLVSIRRDSMEVLVTRDGVDWKIEPMPAAMVTVSDLGPTIAVGDRSVLYLTWSGQRGAGEAYVPSLWVGTVAR
jgi:hypothetical protein